LRYLSEKGMDCPSGYNAADHWMDLLVIDSAIDDNSNDGDVDNAVDLDRMSNSSDEKKVTNESSNETSLSKTRENLINSWDADIHANEVKQLIQEDSMQSSSSLNNNFLTDTNSKKYNNSWSTQFLILLHRGMRNSRTAVFTTLNLVKSGAIGLILGLVWFQLPYTEANVYDRDGYFFFTMTYWVFDSMFNALMSFPAERDIIYKERASGSYHLSAYFVAKSCSEAPTRMALPTLYMLLSYWIAGINNDVRIFFGAFLCSIMSVMSGESIGLALGAAIMDLEKGIAVMTVAALLLMVLGGFFVEQPPVFMDWFKFLSPFKYSLDATRQIVFNKDVPCDGSGLLEKCRGLDVGYVTPSELTEFLGAQGSVAFNLSMLFVLFLVPRYIAYLLLLKKKGGERSV